jgi:hypothetical protein
MLNIGGYFFGNVLGYLVDDGIANVLGLETLRHGTNPFNYLSIRLYGGDPKHGGKASGSTTGWRNDNTENWFYLFKDREFYPNMPMQLKDDANPCQKFVAYFVPLSYLSCLVRSHSFFSGYNFVSNYTPECSKKAWGIIGGTFSTCITPTLRFRFSKIDDMRLVNDQRYSGLAYKTDRKVEAWRIGIIGSLIIGINLEWTCRFKGNPQKVITGVVQLVAAAALLRLVSSKIASNPRFILPVIVGAILS